MKIFEYIIAMLLIVLGLGITQLLNDAVGTFRRRHTIRMHWIPVAWSALVFLWQMQYLWAIFELDTLIRSWTAAKFVVLLLMALLLFVAGALVVPKADDDQGSDAWRQFLDDGRWSLIALALFFFLAFLSNPVLFGIPLWEPDNVMDLILGLVLFVAQFFRSEKAWGRTTLLFTLLSIAALAMLSPSVYGEIR